MPGHCRNRLSAGGCCFNRYGSVGRRAPRRSKFRDGSHNKARPAWKVGAAGEVVGDSAANQPGGIGRADASANRFRFKSTCSEHGAVCADHCCGPVTRSCATTAVAWRCACSMRLAKTDMASWTRRSHPPSCSDRNSGLNNFRLTRRAIHPGWRACLQHGGPVAPRIGRFGNVRRFRPSCSRALIEGWPSACFPPTH